MPEQYLKRLRNMHPRVHCITNYVTANDCANLLLAAGAQPVMADDPEESAQITASADALVINLGTPNAKKIEAMIRSGRQAGVSGIPVVFDPVGVTASDMRRAAAGRLLEAVKFTVIKGNAAEICALCGERIQPCGVDAAEMDSEAARAAACRLAAGTGAVVVITGETDIITDGDRATLVHNGHPVMSRITGTGCQLSALIGAFAAAVPEQPFDAAIAAVCMMGLCGELAASRMTQEDGNASCARYLIDAAYRMDEKTMKEGVRFEEGA